MSQLYELYQKGGKDVFSREISRIAPYFSTVEPYFEELRPGYAEVMLKNRKEVHNHIGTFHAIAMCNGAEAAAGLLAEVSIPKGFRWIPTGIRADYLAKATTDLRIIADGRDIDWSEPGNKDIPVTIEDSSGTEVCAVTIIVRIGRVDS